MAQNKGYLTAESTPESDEYLTPAYAVRPLLVHLYSFKRHFKQDNQRDPIIWCPFDKEDSEYVKLFKEKGYNVVYSHIDDGQDFFEYEPEQYDVIISNPPFSKKDDILKRLYELNKPWCMLLPLPTLQGQKRFNYLVRAQALIFDKRVNFFKNLKGEKAMAKGVSFASIYIAKDFFDNDLMFEKLNTK